MFIIVKNQKLVELISGKVVKIVVGIMLECSDIKVCLIHITRFSCAVFCRNICETLISKELIYRVR